MFSARTAFVQQDQVHAKAHFHRTGGSGRPPTTHGRDTPPSFFVFRSSFFVTALHITAFDFRVGVSPHFHPLLLLNNLHQSYVVPGERSSLRGRSATGRYQGESTRSSNFSTFTWSTPTREDLRPLVSRCLPTLLLGQLLPRPGPSVPLGKEPWSRIPPLSR